MATARKQQVSLTATCWYHCTTSCVRKSRFCGYDKLTGKNYKHRRQWIVDRLALLVQAFGIDVITYSIMSNHHHVLLHVDLEKVNNWSMREVIQQWHTVYRGTFLSREFINKGHLPAAEMAVVERDANSWRERLSDISWFMKALNEPIARRANAEDNCTGKFYEARFNSQALLDAQAILSCMAYIDLNPIRANIATTPETSNFTGIKKRIDAAKIGAELITLAGFQGNERKENTGIIPFSEKDYLELVDLTGRVIRVDKLGAIDNELAPILQRLNIDIDTWLHITSNFEDNMGCWVGQSRLIQQACGTIGRHWVCRTEGCTRLYAS